MTASPGDGRGPAGSPGPPRPATSGPGLPASAKVHSTGSLPGLESKAPPVRPQVEVNSVSWEALPAAPQTTAAASSRYIPGGIAPADMYDFLPGQRQASGGLEVEKKIYFGLQAASCIFVFLAFLLFGRQSMEAAGLYTIGTLTMGVVLFLSMSLSLGLNYWVLFGSEIWGKWTCIGCTGLALVLSMSSLFFAAGVSTLPGASAGSNALTALLNLALQGWFMSILWRDIQELQGR